MAVKSNLRWRPPPSWFYFRCQFWSHNHFPVVAVDIPTNFHKCTSNDCWVIAFCGKSKILIFGNSGPPTKSSCRPKAAFQISHRSNKQFRRYRHSKIMQIWLKMPMPIHCPKMSVFGEFRPLNIIVHCRDPQKALPCVKPRYMSHHALKSVQSFLL